MDFGGRIAESRAAGIVAAILELDGGPMDLRFQPDRRFIISLHRNPMDFGIAFFQPAQRDASDSERHLYPDMRIPGDLYSLHGQ